MLWEGDAEKRRPLFRSGLPYAGEVFLWRKFPRYGMIALMCRIGRDL